MVWLGLYRLFSALVGLISVRRLAEHEKDLELVLLRQQLNILQRIEALEREKQELERAKTFFRSTRINQLQTSLSRAQLLGQYEIFDGDPNMINTEMDRYMAVTPEEIQSAARRYLKPEVQTVMEIVPAPAKEEKK